MPIKIISKVMLAPLEPRTKMVKKENATITTFSKILIDFRLAKKKIKKGTFKVIAKAVIFILPVKALRSIFLPKI